MTEQLSGKWWNLDPRFAQNSLCKRNYWTLKREIVAEGSRTILQFYMCIQFQLFQKPISRKNLSFKILSLMVSSSRVQLNAYNTLEYERRFIKSLARRIFLTQDIFVACLIWKIKRNKPTLVVTICLIIPAKNAQQMNNKKCVRYICCSKYPWHWTNFYSEQKFDWRNTIVERAKTRTMAKHL